MRSISLIALFLAILTTTACKTVFPYWVDSKAIPTVPVLTSHQVDDTYEFAGIVTAVGTVEAFDILGVIAPARINAAQATAIAINSGLMQSAKEMGADAITNIVVSDTQAYPGCSLSGAYLPFSHASIHVSATALRRKTAAPAEPAK